MGSTWNLELIEKVYAATAREARALGIHLLNTLVVEPHGNLSSYQWCPRARLDPDPNNTVARELGFEGIVLGEGGGISTLIYEGLARNQKEAGILAINAGVDVGISFENGYMRALVESVREGIVLLKNENSLLPLKKDLGAVAVIGPNGDRVLNQLGDYVASCLLQLQEVQDVLGSRTG